VFPVRYKLKYMLFRGNSISKVKPMKNYPFIIRLKVDNCHLKKNDIELSELLGFWILSTVLYSKEHNFSETGSVSVLR
jgi:hypothetical protein